MEVSQLIHALADDIQGIVEKDVRKLVKEVLRSYEIQIFYGIPRLEALSNSILTTSSRKKQKFRLIELKVKKGELKNRGFKFRQLDRYSHEVLSLYKSGNSYRRIARAMNLMHKLNVSHETIRKYIKLEEKIHSLEKGL